MNFLFYSGMTFHFRSLLPVMKELVDRGENVSVLSRGCFSEKRIRLRPRSFNDITKKSLQFVSRQIGLRPEFLNRVSFIPFYPHFNIPLRSFYKKQDAFISTTKGFVWLNQFSNEGKLRVAIGYENFLSTYFSVDNNLFPQEAPSLLRSEEDIQKNSTVLWIETGLPFVDAYFQRRRVVASSNKVLLLHPGGYRNVITKMGESRESCYAAQLRLYRTILNALPPLMSMDIKLHPLAAVYHDRTAHDEFAADLDVGIVEGFLGDLLFDYHVILSLGSSALFEILPFNRRLWLLDFFGKERTNQYTDMKCLFIKDIDDLRNKLASNAEPLFSDLFENKIYKTLVRTADGRSTSRILDILYNHL